MNAKKLLFVGSIALLCASCGQNGVTQSRAYRPANTQPSFFESLVSSAQETAGDLVENISRIGAGPTSTEEAGGVIIKDAVLLEQFNIQFRKGMKWVYKTQAPPARVLKPGETITDALSEDSDSTNQPLEDSSEITLEIIDVQGEDLTVKKVTKDISKGVGGSFPDREEELALTKTNFLENMVFPERERYENAGDKVKGSVMFSSSTGGEQISVEGKNYNTQVVRMVADVSQKATAGPNAPELVVKADAKMWIAQNVGIVKIETVSELKGLGGDKKGRNLRELQSFTE